MNEKWKKMEENDFLNFYILIYLLIFNENLFDFYYLICFFFFQFLRICNDILQMYSQKIICIILFIVIV